MEVLMERLFCQPPIPPPLLPIKQNSPAKIIGRAEFVKVS
jgi:hypothetical protein